MKLILLYILLFVSGCVNAQLFIYQRSRTISSLDGTLAIYAVTKVNQAYTGNCIRLRDETTNVETDIGFVGGVLDYATADTFLNGHTGRVATIYDQDGNAQDATQTTEINMAYYRPVGYTPDGLPSIDFNNRAGSLDHFYNISINTDSNDLAWTGVGTGLITFSPGTAPTDIIFSFGGAPAIATISDNVVFRAGTKTTLFASGDVAPVKCVNVTQMGLKLKSGVEASYFYENIQSETFAALTTQRVNTTAILGKRSNGTSKMLGAFKELVVYNSTMTSDVETILKRDQRHCYKLIDKRRIIVFCGHSKASWYTSTNTFNEPTINGPPWKLARMLGEEYVVHPYGVPSATIQSFTASTNYTTVKELLKDATLTPIFIYLDAGNNIGTDDFATLKTRFDNMIADIKSARADVKCIFPTITSRTTYYNTPANEALRLQWNAYLLSDYNNPSQNNYVSDLTLNPFIGPADSYSNTTYMDVDGIHFVTNGNVQVAEELYKQVIKINYNLKPVHRKVNEENLNHHYKQAA